MDFTTTGYANVNVFGYSYPDYVNNVDDCRSTTGYVFEFMGAPLSWNSIRQHSLALITMEAEYSVVCKATHFGFLRDHLVIPRSSVIDFPTVFIMDICLLLPLHIMNRNRI